MKKILFISLITTSLFLTGCDLKDIIDQNKANENEFPNVPGENIENPEIPENLEYGEIEQLPTSIDLLADYDLSTIEPLEYFDSDLLFLNGDLSSFFNNTINNNFKLKEVKSGLKPLTKMIKGQGPDVGGLKINKQDSELIFNIDENNSCDYVAVTVIPWASPAPIRYEPFKLIINNNTEILKIPTSLDPITFYFYQKDFTSLSIKGAPRFRLEEGKAPAQNRPIIQSIQFYKDN